MKVLRQACGATAGRMAALLIAIFADAVAARSMELEKRGEYALLMLIATLAAQFCDFGISSSVTYFSAKNHANKGELLDGIYRLWAIECIVLIIGFTLFFYFFHPSAVAGLVLIPSLCMALFVGSAVVQQSLNGLLVADGLVSKSNILLLLQQLCILIGMLLLSAANALTPNAALAVQMVSRGVVIVVCLRWLGEVRREPIKFQLIRTVFKYGFREYASNLIGIFSYRADQI
ncbi:MAG: oligosaccharide flippase family protein, partial [Verrucomicrobia bacterium]|nr:oligosaccharide flippase family protein [Verrucomicrobiota bacterium]